MHEGRGLLLTVGPASDAATVTIPDIRFLQTHTGTCHVVSLSAEHLPISYGCRGMSSAATGCTGPQIRPFDNPRAGFR